MRIIELEAQENGAHRNQVINGDVAVPDGWAVVPENMTIPDTWPFVNVDAEDKIVIFLADGAVPDPEEPMPTELEQLRADVDFIAIMTGVSL